MNNQKVGQTLVRLRGNKTQEEVARDNTISLSALIKYERGERTPRDEVKQKLADYYKRTVQYIFFS